VVEQGAQRIGATVERLGAFALLDSADVRPLDLRRGLADTLAMVSGELGEDVTVVRDFGDVPAVEAEPRALNQVFLNLLHNAITAIRATGAPGAITVETGVEDRRARVRIRDTGTGMDAAQVASLFEPKLTQQGARVAAGMGLPICACVIAQHGGEIAVDSSPGAGTTVTVLLPTMSIGA
jgi:signal transduction histidine kinase